MIELKNIFKEYLSKSKVKTQAINGVDLKFGDTGLVFVLGKSGCGKSTLLNLIGGLDSADVGDIIVDGVSFKDFKAADYDSFRNQYIGFVFQEFNLIEDITVGDNIALSFSLQAKNYGQNEIDQVLDSVGLKGFSKRMPHELSGGQKQRVAIARAIAKNPKLILADEPTGSLDSQTGDEILQLLKELSKDKLVIAVTHDRELAQKYGDRIIELKDGVVISDSLEEFFEQTNNEQSFKRVKSKLNNKVAFKMGVSNFTKKKMKTLSTLLVVCLSLLAFALTLAFSSYSPESSMADIIEQKQIKHFSVSQYEIIKSQTAGSRSKQKIPKKLTDYIDNNYPNIHYLKDDFIIDNKLHALDMGFEFYGEPIELEPNSMYVTDSYLEDYYNNTNSFIIIEGERKPLNKNLYAYEFLVGKTIGVSYLNNYEIQFVVAGVIKTDYLNYKKTDGTALYLAQKGFYDKWFDLNLRKSSFETDINSISFDFAHYDLEFGNAQNEFVFRDKLDIYKSTVNSYSIAAVLNENTFMELSANPKPEISLSKGEVILSFELYNQLFNESDSIYKFVQPHPQNSFSYVSTGVFPKHIGETINIGLLENSVDERLFELSGLKIMGVAFKKISSADYMPYNESMILSHQDLMELSRHISNSQSILINAQSMDKSQLTAFLSDMRRRDVLVDFEYADFAYAMENRVRTLTDICTCVSVLLGAACFLFIVSFISFSVLNKHKEIGILRALGCRSWDLMKIFIAEALFVAAVSFAFSQLGANLIVRWQNTEMAKAFDESFNLFFVSPLNSMLLFCISFILIGIATILPLVRLAKMKPTQAIKAIN